MSQIKCRPYFALNWYMRNTKFEKRNFSLRTCSHRMAILGNKNKITDFFMTPA